jgi:hypothetical protein
MVARRLAGVCGLAAGCAAFYGLPQRVEAGGGSLAAARNAPFTWGLIA